MPLEKNQIIPLSITGMTAEGNGVGREILPDGTPGMAVFVPGTAVGDDIDCRIVKVQKQLAYGRVERMHTPSPDRQEEAGCPVFAPCGGCVYRHVTYQAEQAYKRQRVADAFARVGGLAVEVEDLVPSEKEEGYRNKAQYPVGGEVGHPIIGFYAPRSHRIVEQHACPLQPPLFADAVEAVYRWMVDFAVPPYNEETHTGLVRHIYIRHGEATGQVMVCLVCRSGKIPHSNELVETLRAAVPGLCSVVVNINRRDTNVILGDDEFALWGDTAIEDELCGLRFRLSPRSFYQVNRRGAERLYGLAAEVADLTGQETLLDLYCGTGTIGLSMAHKVGELIGVEIVEPAVADARRNAEVNGIQNATFICGDAARAAAHLAKQGKRPDVVVVDPPRKGCDEALLSTIADMAPDRVVYVSCDPATLARDCKSLAAKGYHPARVIPVDMFPRTAHVECVCLLSRE